MQVVFDEEQRPEDGIAALFERAAVLALRHEGVDPEGGEVSLSFVDSEEMRTLNARYRGKDSPTDVLSFPMYESAEEVRVAAPPVLLGDIVICKEIAKRQAEAYGHGVERELVYLFVHSMFHLLGYDHEESVAANHEDAEAEVRRSMRIAEEDVLRELRVGR